MTFNEFVDCAKRTINYNLTNSEKLHHALFGISGECGEISSIFQKMLQGHPYSEEQLRGQIGDLLWFVSELCFVIGIELDDVAKENVEKLKKRYPNGFSEKDSIARVDVK